jgi:hypothetical protein
MKYKSIYPFIIFTLMIMSILPGYAAQPFLQGITNGEVIYLKFSEDECLFVAIKNNASSLLYDQKSYPVTSGSVSIMKIAPNGNLEWIKDLYSDLNNMGVDYTENVFYGRPGVIKIETSSSEIFVMVSLSSTYGGKYLVYDYNTLKFIRPTHIMIDLMMIQRHPGIGWNGCRLKILG